MDSRNVYNTMEHFVVGAIHVGIWHCVYTTNCYILLTVVEKM